MIGLGSKEEKEIIGTNRIISSPAARYTSAELDKRKVRRARLLGLTA
jgi:hypothetical protein